MHSAIRRKPANHGCPESTSLEVVLVFFLSLACSIRLSVREPETTRRRQRRGAKSPRARQLLQWLLGPSSPLPPLP